MLAEVPIIFVLLFLSEIIFYFFSQSFRRFVSFYRVHLGVPTAFAVSADLSRAAARQTQLWTASGLARYVSPRFAVQTMPCVWG